MNNDLNIEYFDTLRKSLKDAARTALMNATSEGQIDRIQRLYESKDQAIKDCSNQYYSVQELDDAIGKEEILIMINDAIEVIMETTSAIELQRIISLSGAKINALISIEKFEEQPKSKDPA
tara:strand:- start:67 stop:429 length:363 start_codon:yes stop_codon:yes gene_type:complete